MIYVELDVVYNPSNQEDELYESLGISRAHSGLYIDKAVINVSRIESFYPSVNDEGIKRTTTIILNSGDKWTTTMSYEEFKTKFFNLIEQHEERIKNPGS